MYEVAAVFSEVLSNPVKYAPLSVEELDQQLAELGVDEHRAWAAKLHKRMDGPHLNTRAPKRDRLS
jgi:hypothetical protein